MAPTLDVLVLLIDICVMKELRLKHSLCKHFSSLSVKVFSSNITIHKTDQEIHPGVKLGGL